MTAIILDPVVRNTAITFQLLSLIILIQVHQSMGKSLAKGPIEGFRLMKSKALQK
jgi:hypothetical protein